MGIGLGGRVSGLECWGCAMLLGGIIAGMVWEVCGDSGFFFLRFSDVID